MNLTAFGVLALRAAGAGAGDRAVQRAARGARAPAERATAASTSRGRGLSGIDDTAAALQALVAVRGAAARAVRRAAAFLGAAARTSTAAYPLQPAASAPTPSRRRTPSRA